MQPQSPVVLVTGASRGLGRGIAVELARGGFSVAIHFHGSRAGALETRDACEHAAIEESQGFLVTGGDIASSDDRSRIVDETLGGLGRIDALVNNAGITSPGRNDILEATEAAWDTVMGVNLKGPFFLTQLVARHWLRNPEPEPARSGRKLVFVSSISAFALSTNRGDYCVSKSALGMVNQLWAARLAPHGIHTIEFLPGIMRTDMTKGVREKYDPLIAGGLVPMRRWGSAEDTGRAVRAFLDGSLPFTTGDRIHLDGGFHLRTI